MGWDWVGWPGCARRALSPPPARPSVPLQVVPCLALHDTMRYIKSDVATVGFGACMGMSGFLLATGAKGKRCALPNTRIMLHHPSGAARGQAGDINEEARELMRVRNYMNRVLSGATGKSLKRASRQGGRAGAGALGVLAGCRARPRALVLLTPPRACLDPPPTPCDPFSGAARLPAQRVL